MKENPMSDAAAEQQTEPQKSFFVERLAEKLGVNANAKAIYSDPVQCDGVTVIPVAKVRWGFGGGDALKFNKRAKGGGGGIQISPLGYIEMKEGRSTYRPINDPASWGPLMVIGGVVGWVLLRGLRKLIRGK
jgi:uncharacterized spore protein YtfJ